jgi:hypothetical protein
MIQVSLIIFAIIIGSLFVAWSLLQKGEAGISTLPAQRVMATQIICANELCSGSGERPKRTLLTTSGQCSQCGGMNYLLASAVYSHRFNGTAAQVN